MFCTCITLLLHSCQNLSDFSDENCLCFLHLKIPADTTVATSFQAAHAPQAVNTEGTVAMTIKVRSGVK